MSHWFRLLARVGALLIVAGGGAAAAAWWWLAQPLPLPASPYSFDVPAGASLRHVARDLTAAGIIPGEWPLVALARLHGVDRAIKAGNYEIASGITLPQLLEALTQGDAARTALTVIEGATFAEVKRALRTQAGVTDTLLDLPDAEVMQRIGATGESAEGWFFPDTYYFVSGSTDAALLARAYRLMRARLDAAWERRTPGLPLKDPYDALILASIVEKETAAAADRPLIASVYLNRLRLGMRLQADPTVIYGIGAGFDGSLRKRDLEADTPYNTYTRDGLPPTPIALPGQASLDAVTSPPQTAYLYFVARGDGTSEFSTSLADHNRAVSKYQRGAR